MRSMAELLLYLFLGSLPVLALLAIVFYLMTDDDIPL